MLLGDYPLIHNSEFLRDYGYYYPAFAADEGGRALIDAFARHDQQLEAYSAKNKALIARLAPTHPANIKLHNDLLVAPIRSLGPAA